MRLSISSPLSKLLNSVELHKFNISSVLSHHIKERKSQHSKDNSKLQLKGLP